MSCIKFFFPRALMLVVFSAMPVWAGDPPTSGVIAHVSIPELEAIGRAVDLYIPESNGVHRPVVWVFEADSSGKPSASIVQDSEGWTVQATVRDLPMWVLERLATRAKAISQHPGGHHALKNIEAESLLPPDVSEIHILPSKGSPFKAVEIVNPDSLSVVLHAEVPNEEAAKKLQAEIQSGNLRLDLSIETVYRATSFASRSSARVDAETVNNLDLVRTLNGAASRASSQVDTSTHTVNKPLVALNRNQYTRFRTDLARAIAIVLRVDVNSPGDLEILERRIDSVLQRQIFSIESIAYDGISDAQREMKDFAEPLSIQPDVIEREQDIIADRSHDSEMSSLGGKYAANASIGAIGGGTSAELNHQSMERHERVNDTNQQVQGRQVVPKTLEVYILRDGAFKIADSISLALDRTDAGEAVLRSLVSLKVRLPLVAPSQFGGIWYHQGRASEECRVFAIGEGTTMCFQNEKGGRTLTTGPITTTTELQGNSQWDGMRATLASDGSAIYFGNTDVWYRQPR